ncbi:MAG: alpha/beta hydrolase [Eggerthellaceae bacterium]|nr:alpha/beta hydrolase [Eggerthellaceae bacterium]
MGLNAINGCLTLASGEMDYIRFGGGKQVMVMLPGVGDGLKTVRGMALPFALMYRPLARDFTVYVLSRRRELPEHITTREMVADLDEAMGALGLEGSAVVGVSQGGMIAQWLAIDHPQRVGRLVLVVTTSRPNATIEDVVARWAGMAKRGDYRGIIIDTAERSYSERRLRAARIQYRALGSLGKPRSFARFLTQAESCVTHDAYGQLPGISCPTLVIGGTDDRIVTCRASEEIAERIAGSELFLYEGLGHGLYEEAPDFLERVAAFCRGDR